MTLELCRVSLAVSVSAGAAIAACSFHILVTQKWNVVGLCEKSSSDHASAPGRAATSKCTVLFQDVGENAIPSA